MGILVNIENMIGGILIGFALGVLFSILISGVARSIRYYFRFRADGRLVNLDEVGEKFGSNVTFYLLSDSVIFNVIVLHKQLSQDESSFPWKVFSEGYMLARARTNAALLRSKFPNAEVKTVFFPEFG